MQARLTAFPPDAAAIAMPVRPGEALRIGRAEDSGLRIAHASVSRAHAELRHHDGTWHLRDLGSKNGSFVDGARIDSHPLIRAGWLRFGDIHCEFTLLNDSEAAAAAAGTLARRAMATAHTARIDSLERLDELLDASLRGVLELAQCERGFVLLQQHEGFAVCASLALDPTGLGGREFSGSVGAVRQALELRRSVIANDIGSEAWLSSRESVVAAGLSTLVCLPLHDGEQALGAIYADRMRPGPPVTALDQELLEAFAERAALWIAARRTSELLDARHSPSQAQSTRAEDWNRILAAHAGAVR